MWQAEEYINMLYRSSTSSKLSYQKIFDDEKNKEKEDDEIDYNQVAELSEYFVEHLLDTYKEEIVEAYTSKIFGTKFDEIQWPDLPYFSHNLNLTVFTQNMDEILKEWDVHIREVQNGGFERTLFYIFWQEFVQQVYKIITKYYLEIRITITREYNSKKDELKVRMRQQMSLTEEDKEKGKTEFTIFYDEVMSLRENRWIELSQGIEKILERLYANVKIGEAVFSENVLLKQYYQRKIADANAAELASAEQEEKEKKASMPQGGQMLPKSTKKKKKRQSPAPSPSPSSGRPSTNPSPTDSELASIFAKNMRFSPSKSFEPIDDKTRREEQAAQRASVQEHELRERIQEQQKLARDLLSSLGCVVDWYPASTDWNKIGYIPKDGIQVEEHEERYMNVNTKEFIEKEALTTRHYKIKGTQIFEAAPYIPELSTPYDHDRVCYIPYGSFEYSANPGDLDVFCTVELNRDLRAKYSEIDPKLRVYEKDEELGLFDDIVVLNIRNIEVEIHHGTPDYDRFFFIQNALLLHKTIVHCISKSPSIVPYYDEIKKVCKDKGIYASKYRMFRGVALMILAIASINKEGYSDFNTFKKFIETVMVVQFETDCTCSKIMRNEEVKAGLQVKWGKQSQEHKNNVIDITPKRLAAIYKRLNDEPMPRVVLRNVNYDEPGREYRTILRALETLEKREDIQVIMPDRNEDGSMVFVGDNVETIRKVCVENKLID